MQTRLAKHEYNSRKHHKTEQKASRPILWYIEQH